MQVQDNLNSCRTVKGFDTLAVMLPLTSRNSDVNEQLRNLEKLILSFPTTTTNYYVGVDDDDNYYSQNGEARDRLEAVFIGLKVPYKIDEFPPESPPNICGIAREVAKHALEDDCFYFVLLGDDVTVETNPCEIMPLLRSSFEMIQVKTGLPYGFGCVAFHDLTSIGFPTFPVVTRKHFDIFEEWCPPDFVNQGADPYLFEVYRKFAAAMINPKLVLKNEIGGAGVLTPEPRYERQHIRWQDELLKNGIKRIQEKYPEAKQCVRLDIVVPSYRVPMDYLERIINLSVPPNCSTTVIIIIDNPNNPHARKTLDILEDKYREKVRIRINEENRGASYTRSRGLDESSADWILFLDDDVIPSPDLLKVYVREILKTGDRYAGYVGATKMPEATTIATKGIHLVHLLHFWSDHVTSGREVAPWGITAQLVLKRTHHRFNEIFPKTGGGEDIDLCLRTCRELKLPLKNLPDAICIHPWWDNGQVQISRFYGWSKGDAILVDLYPEHCYRSCPNGLELMLLCAVGYLAFAGYSVVFTTNLDELLVIPPVVTLIGSLLIIFTVDVGFGLFFIMTDFGYQPNVKGLERFYCGLYASFFYRFLGADVGHVLSPFARGSFRHLCLRFDWWCGLYPEEVQKLKFKEGIQFCITFVALALFIWKMKM